MKMSRQSKYRTETFVKAGKQDPKNEGSALYKPRGRQSVHDKNRDHRPPTRRQPRAAPPASKSRAPAAQTAPKNHHKNHHKNNHKNHNKNHHKNHHKNNPDRPQEPPRAAGCSVIPAERPPRVPDAYEDLKRRDALAEPETPCLEQAFDVEGLLCLLNNCFVVSF